MPYELGDRTFYRLVFGNRNENNFSLGQSLAWGIIDTTAIRQVHAAGLGLYHLKVRTSVSATVLRERSLEPFSSPTSIRRLYLEAFERSACQSI